MSLAFLLVVPAAGVLALLTHLWRLAGRPLSVVDVWCSRVDADLDRERASAR